MQSLHPSLLARPAALHSSHPSPISENPCNPRLMTADRGSVPAAEDEVPMDTTPEWSSPPSLPAFSFPPGRPQLIQYQQVLFKVSIIIQAEGLPPQVSARVANAELEQALRSTLHCILTDTDLPVSVKTANFLVKPLLKLWPLSQRLPFLQASGGVQPYEKMIELFVSECSSTEAPVTADNASVPQLNDCSGVRKTGHAPSKGHRETAVKVRFESELSTEHEKSEQKKIQIPHKSTNENSSLETQCSLPGGKKSPVEFSRMPSSKTGSDDEAEEDSPFEGIAAKFSKLTFFSPVVRRLRKRKAPSSSPSKRGDCRSPLPKVPRSISLPVEASPRSASSSVDQDWQSLHRRCCSDTALPHDRQQLNSRISDVDACRDETFSPDLFTCSSCEECASDDSEEREDEVKVHPVTSSPNVSKRVGGIAKTWGKLQPLQQLSPGHAAAGDGAAGDSVAGDSAAGDGAAGDAIKEQGAQQQQGQLTKNTSPPHCRWGEEPLAPGRQQLPSARGDHQGSYTSHRESALQRWLADTADLKSGNAWGFSSDDSLENFNLDDSDVPDEETYPLPQCTDGNPQVEGRRHPLNARQPPSPEPCTEVSTTHKNGHSPILCAKRSDQGIKHRISPPEIMPTKRFCRDISAKKSPVIHQAPQTVLSWCKQELGKKAQELSPISEQPPSPRIKMSPQAHMAAHLSPMPCPSLSFTDSDFTLSSDSEAGGSLYNSVSTSPDSPAHKLPARKSARPKVVPSRSKPSKRSPKVQASCGGKKGRKKNVKKTNSGAFWAQSNTARTGQRGIEFVQTQIKLFVKKGPPERCHPKKKEVPPESQGEISAQGDPASLQDSEMAAVKPLRKKRLYTGNVLLGGDGSGEGCLGKTLEDWTRHKQQPKPRASKVCRSICRDLHESSHLQVGGTGEVGKVSDSNKNLPNQGREGKNGGEGKEHFLEFVKGQSDSKNSVVDSDSGICNGNHNGSSDSQDMACANGGCSFELKRSDGQLIFEQHMDVSL